MRNKNLLPALIGFQLLIILGMLGKAMYPLLTGRAVELAVVAYDPRDIFRGNYVALTYDFNAIDLSRVPNDIPEDYACNYGDEFYVELKPEGDLYKTAGVWRSPPKSGAPFIKTIAGHNFFSSGTLWLNGGIETYFTDPESARELEDYIRQIPADTSAVPLVTVTVKVTSGGAARIQKLNVKPPEMETKP